MLFIKSLFLFLKYMFYSKIMLIVENLSLRQQLAAQMRSNKRPKLTNQDRIFMVLISKIHSEWQSFLAIVHCDCCRLASPTLQTLLAMEIPKKGTS